MNLDVSFVLLDCLAIVSVIAKIYGKVICLISSVDIRNALTRESKILASISWFTLTDVNDFNTSDHICERYFVYDSVSVKWEDWGL